MDTRNARLSIGAGCCRRGWRASLPPPVRCWRPAHARRRGRYSSIPGAAAGLRRRKPLSSSRSPRRPVSVCRLSRRCPTPARARCRAVVTNGTSPRSTSPNGCAGRGLIEPIDWTVVQKDKLFRCRLRQQRLYCALGTNCAIARTSSRTAVRSRGSASGTCGSFRSALALQRCAAIAGLRAAGGRRTAGKLYPMDIDRGFRKLDQIKPHIKV